MRWPFFSTINFIFFFYFLLGTWFEWHWRADQAVQQRKRGGASLRHRCHAQSHLREHGKQDGPAQTGRHPFAGLRAQRDRWGAPQKHHRWVKSQRSTGHISDTWDATWPYRCPWNSFGKPWPLKLILFKPEGGRCGFIKACLRTRESKRWSCCRFYRGVYVYRHGCKGVCRRRLGLWACCVSCHSFTRKPFSLELLHLDLCLLAYLETNACVMGSVRSFVKAINEQVYMCKFPNSFGRFNHLH